MSASGSTTSTGALRVAAGSSPPLDPLGGFFVAWGAVAQSVALSLVIGVVVVLVPALVVVACSLLLGLISSLRRTVTTTGDPLNLVMLRKGSSNDRSIQTTLEAYQFVRFLDGVATDAVGQPVASPELVVEFFFRTLAGGRENVLVRGVEPVAFEVHREVRRVEGRAFRSRVGKAMAGTGVRGRYAGAELGQELAFGRGRWKAVGVFASGGSSFESEAWVDATTSRTTRAGSPRARACG